MRERPIHLLVIPDVAWPKNKIIEVLGKRADMPNGQGEAREERRRAGDEHGVSLRNLRGESWVYVVLQNLAQLKQK